MANGFVTAAAGALLGLGVYMSLPRTASRAPAQLYGSSRGCQYRWMPRKSLAPCTWTFQNQCGELNPYAQIARLSAFLYLCSEFSQRGGGWRAGAPACHGEYGASAAAPRNSARPRRQSASVSSCDMRLRLQLDDQQVGKLDQIMDQTRRGLRATAQPVECRRPGHPRSAGERKSPPCCVRNSARSTSSTARIGARKRQQQGDKGDKK